MPNLWAILKMNLLKLARQEVGLSKHISLTHLNSPSVFEGRNGEVGSVIKLRGMAFDTSLNQDLNSAKRAWHHALCQVSEDYRVMVSITRRKVDIKLEGEFQDDFSRQVDQEYHAQFHGKNLYQNDIYLSLTHRGLSQQERSRNFFLGLSRKSLERTKLAFRERAMSSLDKTSQQVMTYLSRFGPELIGTQDDVLGYSELLENLSRPFNALRDFSYRTPVFLPSELALYPDKNLAMYLPRMRIFFGEAIKFQAQAFCEGNYYAKCLSIKEYGVETSPVMLDPLLNLDIEFLQTHSFSIEPCDHAQKLITRQIVKLENSNDPAKSQIQELAQLKDDLASGHVKTGFYHHSLMLVSPDLEHLNSSLREAIRKYGQAGLVAVEETIGLEPTFWAQMPTNASYIVRAQAVTSANFVDFCPLHNYRGGYKNKNHLGSAITLIQTPSRTPMFFNYHSEGSGRSNDLTPGHATIIGGNGSGKTVFLGLMDAQMGRYGGQSFIFDRDHGLEIYIRAAGGTYLSIEPGENLIPLNPFVLKDTAENRLFLKNWLGELIKEEGEVNIPSAISVALGECVDYAYEVIAPESRHLSTVAQFLPIDFPRWNRLHQWMNGSGIRLPGEYAYLFDHPEDALSLKTHKIGFDLSLLMSQPKSVLTAVMMYLFRRIEEVLTGQRVSILLDEGWMYLDNPYWQVKLKQWLPTLRKKNCHIVLATQSPESIVNSLISSVFFDNCATNIFFCNEKANFEKHYRHFNITESEFEFLKNTARERRLFLYKQGQDSAVCHLDLSQMEDYLAVFSGNAKSVELVRKIRAEVGDDPEDWLKIFHEKIRESL